MEVRLSEIISALSFALDVTEGQPAGHAARSCAIGMRIAHAAGVPDDELNKITWENACRWYSFDPFQHRSRADATVGALRREAEGHDVSIRSFDKGRFERSGKGIDAGTIAAKATA